MTDHATEGQPARRRGRRGWGQARVPTGSACAWVTGTVVPAATKWTRTPDGRSTAHHISQFTASV